MVPLMGRFGREYRLVMPACARPLDLAWLASKATQGVSPKRGDGSCNLGLRRAPACFLPQSGRSEGAQACMGLPPRAIDCQ